MKSGDIESELQALKRESVNCTEQLLQLTKHFSIHDIAVRESIIRLRKAIVAQNDAYERLVEFIDEQCRKVNA